MIDEIKKAATALQRSVIANRRHLHAHPELSFHEFNTAAFVKQQLDTIGITWQPMAQTGVVALIQGEKKSNRVIALRADLDALPITEENAIDYASQNPGVMHACGHDAHTASLLGAATILHSLRSKFGGTIKLIFQPGEEKLPGGASLMIKEGVLDHPAPHSIIGQHVSPLVAVGNVAIRKGKFMASMDEISMKVIGKGGHGAQPHLNIDPVMITAQILVALQQIVSRHAHPSMPTVLSFGKVIANGAFNVIPDEVYLAGTFRTMDERWRNDAHLKMKKMATSIAEGMGGQCEFNIIRGYPYLINEEKLTHQVSLFAEEYLGKEHVMETEIWMAAEDFAYYSQQTNACFYLLGIANPTKGITSNLHTPTFNLDEDSLVIGSGLMAYLAVKQLGN